MLKPMRLQTHEEEQVGVLHRPLAPWLQGNPIPPLGSVVLGRCCALAPHSSVCGCFPTLGCFSFISR